MDIFSHIFVLKICNVCLKRPKIKEKEAGNGPFLKKIMVAHFSFLKIYNLIFKWQSECEVSKQFELHLYFLTLSKQVNYCCNYCKPNSSKWVVLFTCT